MSPKTAKSVRMNTLGAASRGLPKAGSFKKMLTGGDVMEIIEGSKREGKRQ